MEYVVRTIVVLRFLQENSGRKWKLAPIEAYIATAHRSNSPHAYVGMRQLWSPLARTTKVQPRLTD